MFFAAVCCPGGDLTFYDNINDKFQKNTKLKYFMKCQIAFINSISQTRIFVLFKEVVRMKKIVFF